MVPRAREMEARGGDPGRGRRFRRGGAGGASVDSARENGAGPAPGADGQP